MYIYIYTYIYIYICKCVCMHICVDSYLQALDELGGSAGCFLLLRR